MGEQLYLEPKKSVLGCSIFHYFCLTEKFRDRNTGQKPYQSLLKTFLNNKIIPCIPPLFYENDFIINFLKKPQIFNEFFEKPCRAVPNFSKLPSALIRKPDKYLSTVTFYENEIKKSLDKNYFLNDTFQSYYDLFQVYCLVHAY